MICGLSTGPGNVKDTSIQKAERKSDWALSQSAFSQLLAWLDGGRDSGGEGYLETRQRLVSYFDRKDCLAPDELADETLNRVARRLEEEGSITDTTPAQYCYIVAKYVFMEYLRRTERRQVSLDELPGSNQAFRGAVASSDRSDETENEERRLNCLEQCLQHLEADSSEIIIQYYHGEQRVKIDNRRALAERLGVTMNALSIRACRIRDKLEACARKCMSDDG
jgi:DNA-directed RNA polymerase specialized sigma24 family protein